MDRAVEKQTGLSRPARLGLAAGGAALLLAVLLAPAARRWSKADRTVELASLRLGTVERGDLVRDASAQGRIVAALHPTLFAPAAGIVALKVRAGETVKKGQLLARVESPELMSRLQQERSALLSMQSALGRQKILARQSAARSAQEIDVLEVKLSAAERLMDRAERTYRRASSTRPTTRRRRTTSRSPQFELRNAKGAAVLDRETAEFDIRGQGGARETPGRRRGRALAPGRRARASSRRSRASSPPSPSRTATPCPRTRRSSRS